MPHIEWTDDLNTNIEVIDSQHHRIVDYIGEELGIPTETLNPFVDSSNFVSLTPSPEIVSEQSSFVPAMAGPGSPR